MIVHSDALRALDLPEFSQIHVRRVQGWYLPISSSAVPFCSLQGRGAVNQGSQRGRQWRGSSQRQPTKEIQELGPEQEYPSGRERGLLVIGGAETKSELKGSIATWECQRVGRKGGQRWRKKGRNAGRLRLTREVGEKAT